MGRSSKIQEPIAFPAAKRKTPFNLQVGIHWPVVKCSMYDATTTSTAVFPTSTIALTGSIGRLVSASNTFLLHLAAFAVKLQYLHWLVRFGRRHTFLTKRPQTSDATESTVTSTTSWTESTTCLSFPLEFIVVLRVPTIRACWASVSMTFFGLLTNTTLLSCHCCVNSLCIKCAAYVGSLCLRVNT